ncbi:hypothetical protein SGLAM104S_08127 [Streptomyces glaucescens]
MLVLMTESSARACFALGEICDRRANARTITRGLRTDGIATSSARSSAASPPPPSHRTSVSSR